MTNEHVDKATLVTEWRYLCPADETEQEIELEVFLYSVPPGRVHIYRVPEDPSYLDKWRTQNPQATYSEPFRVRVTCKLSKT